jgi:CHAT domain-containing protein
MLNGEVQLVDGVLQWSGGNVELDETLGLQRSVSLAHPYYWSGFTMIGSPW